MGSVTQVPVGQKPAIEAGTPLHGQTIRLADNVAGRALVVRSATPRRFEAIVCSDVGPAVELQAVLFVSPRDSAMTTRRGRHPAVVIVPGSGGVMPPLFEHARARRRRHRGAGARTVRRACGGAHDRRAAADPVRREDFTRHFVTNLAPQPVTAP